MRHREKEGVSIPEGRRIQSRARVVVSRGARVRTREKQCLVEKCVLSKASGVFSSQMACPVDREGCRVRWRHRVEREG